MASFSGPREESQKNHPQRPPSALAHAPTAAFILLVQQSSPGPLTPPVAGHHRRIGDGP